MHYALTQGFATVELMPEMRERILWVLAEANGPLAELRLVLAADLAHRRGID